MFGKKSLKGHQQEWIELHSEKLPGIDESKLSDEEKMDVCASMMAPFVAKGLPVPARESEVILSYYMKGLMAISKPDPSTASGIDPSLLRNKPTNN